MKYKKQLISFHGKLKSLIFSISGILLVGTLLFVFSCSKEEITNENQKQPAQVNFEKKVFIKAIKNFRENVACYEENSGYKSGETVNTDTALLLLEGTMNLSHSFTTDSYNEYLAEDLTLVVPKNENGEVDMDVLIQKYLQMKADITTLYYNSNFENKGLVIVDLCETGQTGDEITMNVEVVTGDRTNEPPPPPPVNGPFETGDNWWYGENAGKCYDTTTTSDAAQELHAAMSQYIYNYNQSHGIETFFPVQTHYFKGGDKKSLRRPNDVMDNHLDFYMYNAYDEYGISDDTLCVEWTEMNNYYSYLRYFLYTKMKDSLQALNSWCYQPAQITSMIGVYEEEGEHYCHKGYFVFGFPWYSEEGEGPEEL